MTTTVRRQDALDRIAAELGTSPAALSQRLQTDTGPVVALAVASHRGWRRLHPRVERVVDRVLAAVSGALAGQTTELASVDVRLLSAWWERPGFAARLMRATTLLDGDVPALRHPPGAIALIHHVAASPELLLLLDGDAARDVTAIWPWQLPGPRPRRIDAVLVPSAVRHVASATPAEVTLLVLQAGPPTHTTVVVGMPDAVADPEHAGVLAVTDPDVVTAAINTLGIATIADVVGIAEEAHVHHADPQLIADRVLGPGGMAVHTEAHRPIPARVALTAVPATNEERLLWAWAAHPRRRPETTAAEHQLGHLADQAGIDLDLWLLARHDDPLDRVLDDVWRRVAARHDWIPADRDDVAVAVAAIDAAAEALAGGVGDQDAVRELRRRTADVGWIDRVTRGVVPTRDGLLRPVPDVAAVVLAAVSDVGLDTLRLRARIGPLRSTILGSLLDRPSS